jgi:hypothetical protein
MGPLRRQEGVGGSAPCTDKKENQVFLIYKEIRMGSCKVIYEEGALNTVYDEMRKYLIIYEEAVSHI